MDPAVEDDPKWTEQCCGETVRLDLPEEATYRIGVHYWDDEGFGSALAAVRVFENGVLAFEAQNVTLQRCDMWDVATVEWPSGKISEVKTSEGKPKITPSYGNSYFSDGGC